MPRKKKGKKASKYFRLQSKGNIKTCHLEIQTSNSKINCNVPVVEIRIGTRLEVVGAKSRSLYKMALRTHSGSQWKVLHGPVAFSNPSKLVNQSVRVTNGKRTVRGVIVKASIDAGGTVSPPTKDGLPEVDE